LLGDPRADVLICIVREMPFAHELIVDRPQGSWKDLASLDEPTVELLLDTIMPPLLLAELCELDQSGDLTLEHSKIRSTGARVKIPLFIGALSCLKTVPSFRQKNLPVHKLLGHAESILLSPLAHTLPHFLGRESLPGSDVNFGYHKLFKEVQGVNQFLAIDLVW
jgi:hypothetical protein